MVVRSDASWKASRSPVATTTVPQRFSSLATAEIIRLVAWPFCVGEAARGDELRQHVELIDKLVIEFPTALIARQRFMAIGWLIEGVPGDEHGAGQLGFVEAQQKVGEAQDRASALVASSPDALRQPVVRPVGERVAVDDEQRPAHGRRCSSFSRTTSAAFLSVRNPRKAGWRISPPAVHSVNLTSATSCGLTQVVIGSSLPRCFEGGVAVRHRQSLPWG